MTGNSYWVDAVWAALLCKWGVLALQLANRLVKEDARAVRLRATLFVEARLTSSCLFYQQAYPQLINKSAAGVQVSESDRDRPYSGLPQV